MATTLGGQYIPAPPVLPENADEQRRQIGDYQVQTPVNSVTGQAFVNNTNTSILSSPLFNRPQNTQPVAQDDKPPVSNTTTQVKANAENNLNTLNFITPQSNILDNFASTTWAASVYLLSPQQYAQLAITKKKNVNGYNLLFQSGGAPNNVGGFQGAKAPGYSPTDPGNTNQGIASGIPVNNMPDAGRNPSFPQDFYIESVTFENLLSGKQTQAAHSVSTLKFTVTEPGNITLLDRLYAAVQDMAQTLEGTKTINYTAAQYLMVIRWYGYDIDGKLIAGKHAPDKNGLSDPESIVEKFIPFQIRKIDWSVTSKLVSYDFECVPVGHSIAGGTRRGTIPYDVSLTAQTVGELLSGPAVYTSNNAPADAPGTSTTSGGGLAGTTSVGRTQTTTGTGLSGKPPKANSAPTNKKTLKSGLAGAMTEYSAQLVNDKHKYLVADTYEVIFAEGADEIKNATITYPTSKKIDQQVVPMSTPASENANQALSNNASSMNVTARNWSITAGMQMIQVIELAIRNSSYIFNQQLTTTDSEGKEIPNESAKNKKVQWYNVTFQAIPLAYDEARNDFAYKVIYIISKYEIPNFDSKYFPRGNFRGVHKRYPYWFTGENAAVLDFTANFNAAYNMTISGGPNEESADSQMKRRLSSNTRDIMMYTYSPRSQESSKGAPSKQLEAAANAGEYLYSIDQPGGSQLRIIGDPAWIQQGSLMGGVTAADLSTSAFLADGTINFDSSQVLFEILWQRPEDYNLESGLADPYARPGNSPHSPQQTNIYQATKVLNELRGGKFEQVITGLLYQIPVPADIKSDNVASISAAMAAAGGTSASQDDSANRTENTNLVSQGARGTATTSGSAVATGSGSAVVTPQVATAQSAMNQASAVFAGTGTPTAPAFALSGSSPITSAGFNNTPFQFTSVIASANPPGLPTGSGVGPVNVLAGGAGFVGTTVTNGATGLAGTTLTNGAIGLAGVPSISSSAPLPLNTTLYNVSQRIQKMAKDS